MWAVKLIDSGGWLREFQILFLIYGGRQEYIKVI